MQRMNRIFSISICTLLLAAVLGGVISCDKPSAVNKPTTRAGDAATPFAVGQVWSYKTRADEPQSRLIICKIEEDPRAGRLVHIAVNNLRMKNLRSPSGFSDNIVHLPFAESALRASVVELEGISSTIPPYESGYAFWRQSFDNNAGGVWTVPLADAIADQEKMYTSAAMLAPSATLPASAPAQ